MKFRELSFERWGHFSDRRLDLSSQTGFHIFCGANEAGKSTILQGIGDLLFGIEARSPYAFRFDYADLRLAAEIEAADGRRLRFRRRKGRQNTILAEDGTALPETVLASFLGPGADRDLFVGLFGLDHERLRRGGEDILQARGALGQMLFEAGAGVVGLGRTLEGLDKNANDLFTARRAAGKPFYQALDRYAEARKRLRERAVGSDEWRSLQARIEETQGKLDANREAMRALDTARSRAERRRRVMPLANTLAEIGSWLEALADAPEFPDGATEAFRDALNRRARSEESRLRCSALAQRLAEELAGLPVARDMLSAGPAIQQLYEQSGGIREQRADLPRREAELGQIRGQIGQLLRQIGSTLPEDRAREAVPAKTVLAELRFLITEETRLRERLRHAEESLVRVRNETRSIEEAAARLPPVQDPAGLRAVAADIRSRGDLDAALSEAESTAEQLRDRCGQSLAALGLWPGDADGLAAAPVPGEATVRRIERDLADLAAQEARALERRETIAAGLAEAEEGIAALVREGDVPDDEAVSRARRLRDTGWTLLRRRLEGNAPDTEGERAFAPKGMLTDAYEAAVRAADRLADRRAAEAGRVARYGQLLARAESARQQLSAAAHSLDAIAEQRRQVEAEWRALWQPVGIVPLPPREMLEWLGRRSGVLRDREQAAAASAQAARLAASRDDARRHLLQALEGHGATPPATATLGSLLRQAEELASRLTEGAAERRRLDQRLAEQRGAVEAARRQVEAATVALAEWEARWTRTVGAAGWTDGASPAAMQAALGVIEELDRRLVEATGAQDAVARMRRTVDAFAAEVAALCDRIAPALSGRDPAEAIQILFQDLDKARRDNDRRADLERRLREAREEAAQAERAMADAERALARLRDMAGIGDDRALQEALERAERRAQLLARRHEVERELLATGDGLSLAQLCTEAAGCDPDGLAAELEEIRRRQGELHEEAAELGGTLAALLRERDELERGRGAEDAAQQAQEALAALGTVAEDWIRLRAASVILRRAVERYRREQQGPLLGRASGLFTRLTRGAFTGLRIDYDDRDQPVLKGERADGAPVEVSGMSDGTRDQLFLALRLAAVERYVAEAEPLPFVADDLLINFDDERSAAAFAVLGELAQSTQVLFFTHHPHLCDVAHGQLGPDRVTVHHLVPEMA